jgi:class 3 adenylate cyclase/tetratricopeptide (TPR) repeat protein
VPPGSRFCPACGTSLVRACHACGAEQPSSAAFCSECGVALQPGARRGGATIDHEERRVVTILFADLAGSTALGERIDPEDLRALQGELYTFMDDEVVRFGGTTEKFAGDAILAVFGVPQAHEDDPERAVRAALAIRTRFGAFAGRVATAHGGTVGIRLGVETGEVVAGRDAVSRGELMVTGDVVNVAARLQQLAAPGEILVGERAHAATQRAIGYGGPRLLDAKGKSEPVPAWDAQAAGAVGGREARGPFVGRGDELALLRLAASRVVRERRPQLVTVFGQAGVGKSRLVSEFADGLDGARILTGRCVPYGDGITYLPLAEVAGVLAGIREDEPAEAAIVKLGRAVEETVPAEQRATVTEALGWTMGLSLPGRSAGLGSGGEARAALHEAWTTYLTLLGREGLLVLVIEDVHWASESLLDLLEHLTARLEDTAVLLVCPARPELLDQRPSWGTGRLDVSAVTLGRLTDADSEGLLRALLGASEIPDEVADRILQPADGNPFYLEEMLAMLVERGAIARRDGGWVATEALSETSVPDSIHGVIAARLDLLEAAEREALRRCSVMGRVFWPSAVGVDEDLVAGLGRRTLVSESPDSAFSGRREFVFKHALTHEVAYATLPRYERGELHRRAAEWLAEAVPDRQAETTELIAFHFDEALRWGDEAEGLRERAYAAALSAGDSAFRRGTPGAARRLLGRSLELAATPVERAPALVLAAHVEIHEAQYERALEHLAEAVGTAGSEGDVQLLADALGLRARASWLRGQWTAALEAAETAVASLDGEPESPSLARALGRLAQLQMLRALPSAEATSLEAIEVARRTGERAAEANALINLFTARSNRGLLPEAGEVAAVVDLARAAGAHDEATRAVVNYLWAASVVRPLAGVEQFVSNMTPSLERGLAAEQYGYYLELSLGALVYVPMGRWDAADDVLAHGEPSVATNRLVWLWLVTGLALRRGDLELVDHHLPELRASALASEEPQRIVPMVGVAIPRAVVAGDRKDASDLAQVVLGLRRSQYSLSAPALAAVRGLAAFGDREALELIVDALAAAPDETRVVTGTALAAVAALEDRHDVAVSELLTVERTLRKLDRHYDAACVALDRAASLERLGDERGAGEARDRANAVLVPLGCRYPY